MRNEEERTPRKRERAASGGATKLPRTLISVLNGSFLARENVLRNMPFILWIAGLMLCYIAYGYHTERTVRELDRTSTELKELRSEYITIRARMEQAERQSQVAQGMIGSGLKESLVPPYQIQVDDDLLEQAVSQR